MVQNYKLVVLGEGGVGKSGRLKVLVCVCDRGREGGREREQSKTIRMCMCVCLCVRMWCKLQGFPLIG